MKRLFFLCLLLSACGKDGAPGQQGERGPAGLSSTVAAISGCDNEETFLLLSNGDVLRLKEDKNGKNARFVVLEPDSYLLQDNCVTIL